jgi:Flp pilus assembly protein TadG
MQAFVTWVLNLWKKHTNYHASHRAGQGLVEFALTLPLLILILVGVLDLGRLSFAAITVTNAAREGARYGAANPCYSACTTIQARAKNEAYGSIIDPAQLNVSTTLTSATCALGNPITVTVTYNFQPITTQIFGGGAIPLRSSMQMPIFGTCP